jgi:hypothetical protein
MPILGVNVDTVGQSGVEPKFIYINTNDTITKVTTIGYLNGIVKQGTPISQTDMALVSTRTTPNSKSAQVSLFDVSHLNGNWSLSLNPTPLSLSDGQIFVGNSSGIATGVTMSGIASITDTGVVSLKLPVGQIFIGSAGGVAVAHPVGGQAIISGTGTVTLKLPNGQIYVGNIGGNAAAVTMSGEAKMDNTGLVSLILPQGAVFVGNSLGAADPVLISSVIKFSGQHTTTGGSPSEAMAISGAVNTDLSFIQLVSPGSNTVSVVKSVVTSNTLTVTFSADPGADAIINYQISRSST